MSEPLRVAMAGAGAISTFHLRGWAAHPAAEVVAICDPDRARAEAQAAEFGIGAVFDDAEAMLTAVAADAVDIVAPVGAHAPLTRLAADRGVHVMCQKPLCATVEEAEALIADIGDRVRFMVHENYRFRPHYQRLGKWLGEGAIGTPQLARMSVRSAGLANGDGGGDDGFLLRRQPYLKDFPKLLVFEVLIHHLDVMRALFGELEVVSAQLSRVNDALRGEDTASIALRRADGMPLALDGCLSVPGMAPLPTDRFEIVGDSGVMLFDRDRVILGDDGAAAEVQDMAANYQACFSGAIADFVAGLRTGAPFATDRHDNIKTLRLMQSVYEAAGSPDGLPAPE